MTSQFAQYDLYFDESGDFQETSSERSEKSSSHTRRIRAASQYVGLLAPRGSINRSAATAVKEQIEKIADRKLDHATKIRSRNVFNTMVGGLVNELGERNWQPVRLVNTEQVAFGNRLSTYVNMVAELAVQIFRRKRIEGQPRVALNIIPAVVKLGEKKDGSPILLRNEQYEPRLREAIGFVNVRRGFAYESQNWRIDQIRTASARRAPELMLCDLLSNASYADYGRLNEPVNTELRDAFGAYDFSFSSRQLFENISELVNQQRYGESIIALAEHLISAEQESAIRVSAASRLNELIEKLAALPGRTRDHHLQLTGSWLEHVIEGQRDLNLGLKLVDFLQNEVADPLRKMHAHIDWFDYLLAFQGLTAANHLGRLELGDRYSSIIQASASGLARQWRHSFLMTRGLIAQAVHKTDCFEFSFASKTMDRLIQCDQAVADLFADDLFDGSQRVRSDLRAQALGSRLQSEMLWSRFDSSRIETARKLSDQAIDEFTDAADISRQYQYRTQLEVAANDATAARRFFAMALGASDETHEAFATAIQKLADENTVAAGFPLLHWLRIGVLETINKNEADRFATVLQSCDLLKSPWVTGEFTTYPAHGIIRRLAMLRALWSQQKQADEALRVMRRQLAPIGKRHAILGLVQIAATMEVASAAWEYDPAWALQRLSTDKREGGVGRSIIQLKQQLENKFPQIDHLLNDWSQNVAEIVATGAGSADAGARLWKFAQRVDY